MSVPPETIHVKRKRGAEDGPVDFLRVEGIKRHRSLAGDGNWIYQRKQVAAESSNSNTAAPSIPQIRATQEGDEGRPIKALRRQPSRPSTTTTSAAPAPLSASTLSDTANEKIRRFHLSRLASPLLAAGAPKKRSAAVFVERGGVKKPKQSTASVAQGPLAEPQGPRLTQQETLNVIITDATVAQQASQTPNRLKRPGVNNRSNVSTPTKPSLPPSLRNRDGVDMEQLAMDMDAYTLSQINNNLDRMEEEDEAAKSSASDMLRPSPAKKSKFKPKAPAQRFAERHPEIAAKKEQEKATPITNEDDSWMMDVDEPMTDDDGDYVLETYERVPASRLNEQAVEPHRVGLLVFDTEPDRVDFFYGDEGDSEDELFEDEDDENAENYYAADYPDEDLDWDDEFDHNPYQFRTDLEEFGESFQIVNKAEKEDKWDKWDDDEDEE
ncbi:hypothetical protein QBC46DRAFT_373994 [Diplogelasinospora grovesii]|uniref:Transcription factor Iwr1 domain-containing protein n=1 Tax=Diplogelasinospora grovesii TaxID=303347 RepID=A0AAN6NF56_9PEZI|nr:hypothetical protein QBC46DRAFT_373994 [Diplogelasinospora grovesii]